MEQNKEALATAGAGEEYVTFTRDRQIPFHYDVELNRMGELKDLHSLELHVVLYPYSKMISSADYTINPFEEYARDISDHLRSSYVPIQSPMANIFGLTLGLIIALVFHHFIPGSLLSVEAIVAILGAYAIGKELYADIDASLVRITKDWPIRFLGHYFVYRIERGATMTSYSMLAKERRYGKQSLMPELFDFIEKSNSITARMYFSAPDLVKFQGSGPAHILSVHMDERLNTEFIERGFMLGIKLALNSKSFGVVKSREMYQSIDGDNKGCLAMGTQWREGSVCLRTTYSVGRIKYFAKASEMAGASLVRSMAR